MLSLRAVSAGVLALLSSGAYGQTLSCQDLVDTFAMTAEQDVELAIDSAQDIACTDFTTISMSANRLTVSGTAEVTLRNIRLEITNGAKLFMEPSVSFVAEEGFEDLPAVDGGAVFVGTGSTARFRNDFSTLNVGVRSFVPEGTDFAPEQQDAGCVYTDGYFVVEGDSNFVNCENSGGGESSPGRGGAMLVDENGSVLFLGTLSMSGTSIIDDEGNNGGGIYNAGKVNIKGDADFDDMRAEAGGAIYNAEGAEFRFKRGASVTFNDCLSFEGSGGAVNNQGYFKLSGPATITDSRSPAFTVGSAGYTRLSEGTSFSGFRGNGFEFEPFILVEDGGRLTGFNDVDFSDGNPDQCSTVLFQEDGTCL